MAFLVDPRSEPMFRVPGVVVFLVVLLLGIEGTRELVWGGATDLIFQKYGFVPLNYSAAWRGIGHAGNWNSGDVIGRIVPWLSYSFFHRDLGRALLYSALLLAFGSIVARRIGAVAFLAFYLVCAAVGAAAHLALHWGSAEPLVGASGAVAGFIAAGVRLLGRDAADQEVLRPLTDRTVLSFSLFWLLFNVGTGLTGMSAGGGFSWETPVGGYLAGLLLIGWAYRAPPPPPTEEDTQM